MKPVNLVLITNHFPFGKGETFLAHELPVIASEFRTVLIIAKDIHSQQSHQLPPNVTVERISPASTLANKFKTALIVLRNLKKFYSLIREEAPYANTYKKRTTAFHFLIKAFELANTIRSLLNKHKLSGSTCLYSYWTNASALAISLLPEQANLTFKRVSRAHGGDLYAYRKENNYQPFQKATIRRLDAVFPVSLHGEQYLKSMTNHEHIFHAYLGTVQPSTYPTQKKSSSFVIVSCSSLIPLKRVHLIIEALSLLDDTIHWVHMGDGPLRKTLETLASQKLSNRTNIRYKFEGHVSNADLMKFYSNTVVDAFINTSEYEGIPVSMMEAQSFGIPVIGTNVGAVNELVTLHTGFLLPGDATPTQIAESIKHLIQLQEQEINQLRKTSLQHWTSHFNAENNFSTFASRLKGLFNEIY